MATEFRLNYTGSEINQKLATVDETKSNLENNYYTSTDIDTKIDEVNASLETKADLVDGKVPIEQLPDDIGGGAVAWEDIENRPFGEDNFLIEVPSDTANGVLVSSQPLEATGGLAFSYIKVSDICFASPEETYGALVKLNSSGSVLDFTIDEGYVSALENGFALIYVGNGYYPLVLNISSIGTSTISSAMFFGEDMVLNFTETGLYFLYVEGMATVDSYENNAIKKIDKKYLPDTLPEVTTNDNGKFLCVDNGVWAIKALSEWTGGSY